MKRVLAVDAGNSKTIAIVAASDGTVLGAGRGGCGDISAPPGPEAALHQIDMAVQSAMDASQTRLGDVAVGYFSMAGADWRATKSSLEPIAGPLLLALETMHGKVTSAHRKRCAKTMPALSFFQTTGAL